MDKEEIIMKEFEALRNEILDRSKRENQAVLWSLTLLVALIGTNHFMVEAISIIPIAFTFFGYIWIENSLAIYAIGTYIKTQIETNVSRLADSREPLLGWEAYIKKKEFNYKLHDNPFVIIPLGFFGFVSFSAIMYQIYFLVSKTFSEHIFISLFINYLAFSFYIYYWNKIRMYRKTFKTPANVLPPRQHSLKKAFLSILNYLGIRIK